MVSSACFGITLRLRTTSLDTTRPSTASQLSIYQKALETLPEDGNVMPKHAKDTIGAHHVTRHYTSIHNILSTASQLSISQKALDTLPEDGKVIPKHAESTIHN